MRPALLDAWLSEHHVPRYRGEQVLRWIYQRGATDFAAMTNVPRELRAALATAFRVAALEPAVVARARDGTRKLLFRLDDGGAIESVLIPDPPRLTLCLSSQAGCGMACEFCATARLGLQRNLTAPEIVGQVLAARALLEADERVSNIVFMGMGEPLANYQQLHEAIGILQAEWGCGFSGRRITVSTVGLIPPLQRLVRETTVNIAVSLTATTDAMRDWLMPVNRKYPLEQLVDACRTLPIRQRRRITFEYVLLAGVNDSPIDAERLVSLLHGVRAKVNLIPFNPFPGAPFAAPTPSVVARFQAALLGRGMNATIRTPRGTDIQAACGQLAAEGSPSLTRRGPGGRSIRSGPPEGATSP